MSKKQRRPRSPFGSRAKPRRPTEGLLDGIARCAEHKFPTARIGPDYVCTAEYLDQVTGLQQVTSVTQDTDGVIRVHFGPTRRLPLFCPCCDTATATANLSAFERRWRGRKVEGFTTYQDSAKGQTWDVIGIVFSGREPEEERTLAIGTKSVQRLEVTER